MDFDEDGIYYSHQNLQRSTNNNSNNENNNRNNSNNNEEDDIMEEEMMNVDVMAVRRHFREFLRMYRQREKYVYRNRLFQLHNRQQQNNNNNGRSLHVDLAHLREYDAALMDYVMNQPTIVIPTMELAAVDALQSLLYDQQSNGNNDNNTDGNTEEEDVVAVLNEDGTTNVNADPNSQQQQQKRIQILWSGNVRVTALRSIQSQHMNKLVKVSGIVISAAKVRSRATQVALACTKCAHRRLVSNGTAGQFANIALPTTCTSCAETVTNNAAPGQYRVLPDQCSYVDQQTLKLQEAPETVPTGEMPRSVLCCVDRTLVDQAPPGTRLTLFAIASMLTSAGKKSAYLQVVGLSKDNGSGDSHNTPFTPAEEQAFLALSRRTDIYDILTNSMAPSLSGDYTVDVKKALLCMLMGGCRKRLPDGCTLRGDINVLLLGDPSMAKSQFLKYATRAAPIGVYTSGKGSSAAGLTASVVRDSRGEFYLEGGAMVLADGGLVAIDEFDKMNPNDRVAIHEAMEQQTISVAKAGITTVLNSRTAVLAAANPVYGRYDDLKSASDNIDLMTTILSRFDLIFLLKDAREANRDKAICRHVMGVHIHHSSNSSNHNGLFAPDHDDHNLLDQHLDLDPTATTTTNTHNSTIQGNSNAWQNIAENALQLANTGVGELQVATLKKYIQYCKIKCQPRLTEEAGDVLASAYVKIRDDVRRTNSEDPVIPITVRQLEALVRLSESLARMRLEEEVGPQDVAEALRLFKVSTMAAQHQNNNYAGNNNNIKNSNHSNNREEMQRTESFLQTRLIVGSTVNQQRIVEEAVSRGYNAMLVAKVLSIMSMRGQLQERNQGRLLKRLR